MIDHNEPILTEECPADSLTGNFTKLQIPFHITQIFANYSRQVMKIRKTFGGCSIEEVCFIFTIVDFGTVPECMWV
jgi:hypothetical protein